MKKISRKEFVELLLRQKIEMDAFAIETFNDDFSYNGDEKKLKYEIMIFSLWIITLCTPPNSPEIKDMLHDSFSEKYWGVKENKPLFEQIDKRYKNYYEAFDMWQKNPKNSHIIGTVIIEIVKNQNPNFSLSEKIPLIDDTEALKAFMLFSVLFELTLKTIGKIKKEYDVENI